MDKRNEWQREAKIGKFRPRFWPRFWPRFSVCPRLMPRFGPEIGSFFLDGAQINQLQSRVVLLKVGQKHA